MNIVYFFIAILVMEDVSVIAVKITKCDNVKSVLSNIRKRRHLTFPPGTAFVSTLSLVKAIMTHAPMGWNIAIEIDVVCPMLSPEMLNALFRKKIHHRQKRNMWEKVQQALDGYNINGRACIYRSICEARILLAPKGKSLVHDILRALFTVTLDEDGFEEEIGKEYEELLETNVCDKIHDCPISLIEVLLALNKSI